MDAADSELSAPLLALAAVAVGFAIQTGNGNLDPVALTAVTLAILSVGAALLLPKLLSRTYRVPEWLPVSILGLSLLWQLDRLVSVPAGMYLRINYPMFLVFASGVAVAAVFIGSLLSEKPWLGALSVVGLVAVHLWLGAWLLRASPSPFIDVFTFHKNALTALLHGVDPYALTNPNIYGPSGDHFYGEGLVVNGVLQVGFPYPPLSLLMALPGHLLAGDYRASNLVALDAAALLMAFARPGRLPKVAAASFLFTPRIFFVLEQGWTESLVVFLFALCIFLACRRRERTGEGTAGERGRGRWTVVALGLLFAVKQHLVLLAGLAHLLFGRPFQAKEHLRRLGLAAGLAALVTVPFALWNLPGFFRSVVMFQIQQPFRVEALSYLAQVVQWGGPQLPSIIAFVVAVLGLAVAAWAARWTPAGFATAACFTYLLFFAFNKQAFCNYYFMVLGMLCCALSAVTPAAPAETAATGAEGAGAGAGAGAAGVGAGAAGAASGT